MSQVLFVGMTGFERLEPGTTESESVVLPCEGGDSTPMYLKTL